MNKKLPAKQFYQPSTSKTTNCTNNVTFLPSPPTTWGANRGALCTVCGGSDPGDTGTLGALQRTDGDRADSIFPCSGRCQFVDFETESQRKHLAVQILQNNNLHFSHVFNFDKRSLFFLG